MTGKVISIANQKGGVGKTTTAINLGASLALAGQRVLIVDFDSQGNATTGLGKKKKQKGGSSLLYMREEEWKKEVLFCKDENFYLVPGGPALRPDLGFFRGKERSWLNREVAKLRGMFDFVLIDCPPSIGRLSEDALCIADKVLVPVQCEFFAMDGLSKILAETKRIRGNENEEFFLEGILLTMYEEGIDLCMEVVREIQRHFDARTFLTRIPRDISFSEANSYGQSIIRYDLFSKGARGYIELAREVL